MQLLVHELENSLYQEITMSRDVYLYAVKPHIYKHNSPTGTIKVVIRDTNDRVIAESATTNAATISSSSYFHGYVRFLVNAGLKSGVTYRIALVSGGGYSFSESAYFGWCNDYDLRKVTADYTPNSGYNAALDLELWERKQVVRSSR